MNDMANSALKLQLCTGVPGKDATVDADFRGSEPSDTHQTLFELDPLNEEETNEALLLAPRLNALIRAKFPAHLPEHPEFRVMDSDGHP